MNKMKSFLFIAALLAVSVMGTDKAAFGWGTTGGDGSRYAILQETAVFFNNSGGTLSAGDVVILDLSGTGVSAGSTLGSYVTTTTSADSVLVVGVAHNTSADQTPVVVITKGPIDTRCDDAGDAVTSGSAVGSTTTAKMCGGGTNLGVALEAGAATFGDQLYIWVDPTGAD